MAWVVLQIVYFSLGIFFDISSNHRAVKQLTFDSLRFILIFLETNKDIFEVGWIVLLQPHLAMAFRVELFHKMARSL